MSSATKSPRKKRGKDKKDKKDKKGKGKDEAQTSSGDLKRAASEGAMGKAVAAKAPQAHQGVIKADQPCSFTIGSTVVSLSHHRMLNDDHFFDLELLFSSSAHKHARQRTHKFVVDQRCPGIIKEGVFVGKPKKKKQVWTYSLNEDLLPRMTPAVLNEIFHWVYTDYIDFNNKELGFVLDLTATAGNFGLDAVSWQCEHYLRSILNMDTSFLLLRGAHERQLERVKNFTLEYAFDHWEEFIASKSGATQLGLDLYQEVTTMYTTGQKVNCPEEAKPKSKVVDDFKQIHKAMPDPDVAIKCGDVKFPAHKAVLAAHSMSLATALKEVGHVVVKKKQTILPEFELDSRVKDPQTIEKLLSFIYWGDRSLSAPSAVDLIHNANRRYNLHDAQVLCEWVISQNIRKETALAVLGTTYLDHLKDKENMHELRRNSTQFIVQNMADIDLEPLKAMPYEVRTDVLFAVQAAIRDGFYKPTGAPAAGGASPAPASAAVKAAPAPTGDAEDPADGGDDDDDDGSDEGEDVIVI